MDFVRITTYASYSYQVLNIGVTCWRRQSTAKMCRKKILYHYLYIYIYTYFVFANCWFYSKKNFITTICFRNMKILGQMPLKSKLYWNASTIKWQSLFVCIMQFFHNGVTREISLTWFWTISIITTNKIYGNNSKSSQWCFTSLFICNGTTENYIYHTQFIPVPILSPQILRITFQLLLFFVRRKQFPNIYQLSTLHSHCKYKLARKRSHEKNWAPCQQAPWKHNICPLNGKKLMNHGA
jgi:hypothetical protein